ncbi:CPBP family intramembrane glutamic endopeptidase [Salinibaculum rarum]|uniref:CPBP family intramembrane glutamic endopeptidase n=1 Tax=Salinibaculum rarum TaxID=3058903 RepID=UPI00265F53DF|nr:type II CAAX endopeptidase family protein [Salinibaculum sp. KK48]
MSGIVGSVKGLFWNSDELRLRALFRVVATGGLLLLVVTLAVSLVDIANSILGLPSVLSQVATFSLIIVGLVALAWFIDRRRLRDMGLSLDRQWGRDLLVGLGVGVVMVAVAVALLVGSGLASVGSTYAVENPDFSFAAGSTATGVLSGFLFFAAFATLEEVIVRGYLLVNIAEGIRQVSSTDRRAVAGAIAITAALFGLLHAANPGGTALSLVNITIAGLFFGVAYAATDRLAFPIGAHIGWNFAVGSLFGLPVSGLRTDSALLAVEPDGPTLLTGGSFGPEGGVVMLVGLLAGIAVFVWWVRQQYGTLAVDGRIAIPDLWIATGDDS